MSIHGNNQTGYVVRWREAGRQPSRKFDRKRDAQDFDAKVRQARQRGEPIVASTLTLSELVAEWAPRKARNLEPQTAAWYARLFDDHVEPYLGDCKLADLRPSVLMDWQEARLAEGAGATAVRRSAMLLSQILDYAVRRELIPTNHAANLERPRRQTTRDVVALSPEQIERIRAVLLADDRHGDTTLVSVLAYTGLRPGEALGLEWRHVRGRTLLVEQRNAEGGLRPSTKTARNRSVALLAPVARDLAEWKLAMGARDRDLVFPNHRGEPWSIPGDLHNWRRRVWRKVAPEGVTPYALRHSYASLLIHAGRSVTEVAQELGHGPEMTMRRYAHVFREAPERGLEPADLIRLAREKVAAERAQEVAS